MTWEAWHNITINLPRETAITNYCSSGHRGALLAACVPGLNIIRMLLIGSGMWKDEATVKSMSRFGDRRLQLTTLYIKFVEFSYVKMSYILLHSCGSLLIIDPTWRNNVKTSRKNSKNTHELLEFFLVIFSTIPPGDIPFALNWSKCAIYSYFVPLSYDCIWFDGLECSYFSYFKVSYLLWRSLLSGRLFFYLR